MKMTKSLSLVALTMAISVQGFFSTVDASHKSPAQLARARKRAELQKQNATRQTPASNNPETPYSGNNPEDRLSNVHNQTPIVTPAPRAAAQQDATADVETPLRPRRLDFGTAPAGRVGCRDLSFASKMIIAAAAANVYFATQDPAIVRILSTLVSLIWENAAYLTSESVSNEQVRNLFASCWPSAFFGEHQTCMTEELCNQLYAASYALIHTCNVNPEIFTVGKIATAYAALILETLESFLATIS
jgi:hypothetical protein